MKRQANRQAGEEAAQNVDVSNVVTNDHGATPPHADVRTRELTVPHNQWVIFFLKTVSALLVVFFFVIPAFIKIYPAIISDVAFLNHLRWPPFVDLTLPNAQGLNATRNFRLDTASGVNVGAWHILPSSLATGVTPPSDDDFPKLLSKGPPIILYLHGNAGTRAGWHRVQMYKLLAQSGFHVVTFDYRGYGDSTGHPTEEGLVDDSIAVFKWIKEQAGKTTPVYIWGHSLGSGVATKTALRLAQQDASFHGLILESPFNNFIEAASNHPFTLPFRFLPWFTWCFIEGVKTNNIRFSSDENIAGVKANTLILHATDDGIVPYSLGLKLFDAAQRTKKIGTIEFVSFDGQYGYGHKHIHKAPNLPDVVRKFTIAQLKATN